MTNTMPRLRRHHKGLNHISGKEAEATTMENAISWRPYNKDVNYVAIKEAGVTTLMNAMSRRRLDHKNLSRIYKEVKATIVAIVKVWMRLDCINLICTASKETGDKNGDVLGETRLQRFEPHNGQTRKFDNNGKWSALEVTKFGLCYMRRCRGKDCDCYVFENFFQKIKSECKRKDRDELVCCNAEEEKDPHYWRLLKISKEFDAAKERKDPHYELYLKDLKAYGKSTALEWKKDGTLDVTPHFSEGSTSPLGPSIKIRDNEKPGSSCAHNDSEFRRRLFEFLRRPYDEEYVMHRNAAGLYLYSHPEIEEKLSEYRHKPGTWMTILRGFFFWLHFSDNMKEEEAFLPWRDGECLAVEPLDL